MGYPFDRPANAIFSTLEQFVQPNMNVQDIRIRFTGSTVKNPRNQLN